MVVGGIIVRQQDVPAIRAKLRSIQLRVIEAMRYYKYPILDSAGSLPKSTSRCRTELKRLMEGGLPELHATELWNSLEAFQTSWPTPNGQFERHLGWIEEALSLLSEYEIVFRPNFVEDVVSARENNIKYTTSVYDQLRSRKRTTSDVRKERAEEIIFDPYVSLQISMLLTIGTHAQQWGWTVKPVGDAGKNTVYLKKLTATFNRLKETNLLETFPIPNFMDSCQEPMLQLADIATYVIYKHLTLTFKDKNYELVQRLFNQYIYPRILHELAPNTNGAMTNHRHYAIYRAVQVKITLVHAGWDQKTLKRRREIADEEVTDIIRDLKAGRLRALVPKDFYKAS